MKISHAVMRPLGSGIAMATPLTIGIILQNPQICSMGTLGAFAYLAFQELSLSYNLKAIFLHGLALVLAFNLGGFSALFPWTVPFIIAVLSFFAFVVSKVFRIPKPNYFFVIMLFATGFNFKGTSVGAIIFHSTYLFYGLVGSLLAGLLVAWIEGLPLIASKSRFNKLAALDKYYVMLYEQPTILLNGLHYSLVLFIAAYIAFILRESNGYWVLISSAAVLAGENMDNIKKRTLGRVVGGMVGISLGLLLISLGLPLEAKALVLIVLNILTEFYMPKNYLVANFFTNPQVLLLMTIGNNFAPMHLIPSRFSGALIGSLLAMVLIFIMEWAQGRVTVTK